MDICGIFFMTKESLPIKKEVSMGGQSIPCSSRSASQCDAMALKVLNQRVEISQMAREPVQAMHHHDVHQPPPPASTRTARDHFLTVFLMGL